MTTTKQLRANRRNASVSTGPKTDAGKARSGRNALRHGLAIPIWSDPIRAAEIEALADRIAGQDSTPEVLGLARAVAEAQIDLSRIRMARRQMIEPGFSSTAYVPQRPWRRKGNAGRELMEPPQRPATRKLLEILHGPPTPEKLALVLADRCGELEQIDRYERRASSRLNSAIRRLLKEYRLPASALVSV